MKIKFNNYKIINKSTRINLGAFIISKIKPVTNCNWSYSELFNGIKGE